MTDVVDTSDAAFQRDAALYETIRKHGIRPVVWNITPEEATSLAAYFDKLFRIPATATDDNAEQRKREAERHAPLFRAIRKG